MICETIMIISEKYGDSTDLDVGQFLVWHYAGLLGAKSTGTDISMAEAEIARVIESLPLEMQGDVRRKMAELSAQRPVSPAPSVPKLLIAWFKRILVWIPFLQILLRPLVKRSGLKVNTSEAGVENIIQFSNMVSPLISSRRNFALR